MGIISSPMGTINNPMGTETGDSSDRA